MSTYLELLEKKGLKLNYEQIQARKALKVKTRTPTRNKLQTKMDDLVRRSIERGRL